MAAPPILPAQRTSAATRRSQAQKSAAARYRPPSGRVYVPPPQLSPRPAPPRVIQQVRGAPPIITAKASPARAYRAQSHAAAYAAAPHKYGPVTHIPSWLPPQIRGHYVTNKQGQQVLIHAVGPGKWVEGRVPGYPSPPKPAPARPPALTDTTAPGPSDAAVNAFKQSNAYKQAIVDVFLHQSPVQQAAILHGLSRSDMRSGPEAQALREAASAARGAGSLALLGGHTLTEGGKTKGALGAVGGTISGFLGGAGHALVQAVGDTRVPGASPTEQQLFEHAAQAKGVPTSPFDLMAAAAGKAIEAIPTRGPSGPGEQIAQRQAGVAPGTIGKNLGKDVASLYTEAIPSIAAPLGHAAQGQWGQAAQQLIGPYQQMFAGHGNIGRSLTYSLREHPGLTYAMLAGPLHGAVRAGAAPVEFARAAREARLGRGPVSRAARPGIHLTGNLSMERPPYSQFPLIRGFERGGEKINYMRDPKTGLLVPKGGHLLRPRGSEGTQMRRLNAAVGALFSGRERIRRANREFTRIQREQAVRAPVPKRVAKAAAHAYKKGEPVRAVIPHAEVLARIADLTVRSRKTWVQDLTKHRDQVFANLQNLEPGSRLRKEAELYVARLTQAIRHPPKTQEAWNRIVGAAEQYRQHYGETQAEAHALGHFGDMSKEALTKRAWFHYAATHMDARHAIDPAKQAAYDAKIGPKPEPELVHDVQVTRTPQGRYASQKPPVIETITRPLPLDTIREHARANGVTREPAYTPDYPRSGSGYYVASERRPLPKTAQNRLFAYTHGLTEPGHEALTDRHVMLQGIVDAHHSMNEYLHELGIQRPERGYWKTWADANDAAKQMGPNYTAINTAQAFHPTQSLNRALEGVNPATMEEEATRRSLSLDARTDPSMPGNRWAVIDRRAMKFLRDQQNMVSPNTFFRSLRGLNNAFREAKLTTSARHVPGIVFEQLIRDIGYGVGFRSWLTGRRQFKRYGEMYGPAALRELRARQTGGMVSGMTEFGRTHSTAHHYEGSWLHGPVKAIESFWRNPGARQLHTAWKGFANLVIGGTKHVIEEQHQIAAHGKLALRQHSYGEALGKGGFLELVKRLVGLHGQILDDATRGLHDPQKQRQAKALSDRIYGKWTDMTPTGKTALMLSPFGMWWVNSARYLGRMPIDQPVKTSALAAATVGSEKQRREAGLDLFAPNHLPLYKQGSVPMSWFGGPKGRMVDPTYYSPFGLAVNPGETATSLIAPWEASILETAAGRNWLMDKLTSPEHPRGGGLSIPNYAQAALLNVIGGSFAPFWTQASAYASGGKPTYDVGPGGFLGLFPPVRGKTAAGHGTVKGKGVVGKPGDRLSAVLSSLHPWREVKPSPAKQAKKGGGGSHSPWGGGGGASPWGSSGGASPWGG